MRGYQVRILKLCISSLQMLPDLLTNPSFVCCHCLLNPVLGSKHCKVMDGLQGEQTRSLQATSHWGGRSVDLNFWHWYIRGSAQGSAHIITECPTFLGVWVDLACHQNLRQISLSAQWSTLLLLPSQSNKKRPKPRNQDNRKWLIQLSSPQAKPPYHWVMPQKGSIHQKAHHPEMLIVLLLLLGAEALGLAMTNRFLNNLSDDQQVPEQLHSSKLWTTVFSVLFLFVQFLFCIFVVCHCLFLSPPL